MLLSNMDPFIVETLKQIVKKDMKREIEDMKKSDKGCSEKCRLTNEILKIDNDRLNKIFKVVQDFKWCDICSNN